MKRKRCSSPFCFGGMKPEFYGKQADRKGGSPRKEEGLFWTACLAGCLFVGETFYGRAVRGLVLIPLFPAAGALWAAGRRERERRKRLVQFLDSMDAFATALKAGYAAENAITQSRREMQLLYGASADICRELLEMEHKLGANRSLEEVFEAFAKRSGLPEAKEISGILRIVKLNGGDLAETVRHGVRLSREQLRLSGEIETLLSGKRYEGKVMKIMPVVILWMLRLTSPGFLDPLYHTVFGICVMTGCLVLYGAAWLWEERLFQTCI